MSLDYSNSLGANQWDINKIITIIATIAEDISTITTVIATITEGITTTIITMVQRAIYSLPLC